MEPNEELRKVSEDKVKSTLKAAGIDPERFLLIMSQIRYIMDQGSLIELDFLHRILDGAITSVSIIYGQALQKTKEGHKKDEEETKNK